MAMTKDELLAERRRLQNELLVVEHALKQMLTPFKVGDIIRFNVLTCKYKGKVTGYGDFFATEEVVLWVKLISANGTLGESREVYPFHNPALAR